jgi:hypothetical protein
MGPSLAFDDVADVVYVDAVIVRYVPGCPSFLGSFPYGAYVIGCQSGVSVAFAYGVALLAYAIVYVVLVASPE